MVCLKLMQETTSESIKYIVTTTLGVVLFCAIAFTALITTYEHQDVLFSAIFDSFESVDGSFDRVERAGLVGSLNGLWNVVREYFSSMKQETFFLIVGVGAGFIFLVGIITFFIHRSGRRKSTSSLFEKHTARGGESASGASEKQFIPRQQNPQGIQESSTEKPDSFIGRMDQSRDTQSSKGATEQQEASPELIHYIQEAAAADMSNKEISEALHVAGWSADVINIAFHMAGGGQK